MPNHIHGIVNMIGTGFKPAPTGKYPNPMSSVIAVAMTFSEFTIKLVHIGTS